MKYLLLLSIFFMNLTCERNTQEPQQPETLGKWGSKGVKMNVKETVTEMEFDCATIPTKIKAVGTLVPSEEGTYTFEGGPVLANSSSRTHPATFRGSINGDEMKISVTLKDMKMADIEFTVKKNTEGVLFKCL
jgi:hypothetical protein